MNNECIISYVDDVTLISQPNVVQ